MTLDRLVKHAEKFGCEGVYGAAVGADFPGHELLALGLELRKVAEGHRKSRRPRSWWQDAAPKRLPNGETAEAKAARLSKQSNVPTAQEGRRKRSHRRAGLEDEFAALLKRYPKLMPSVVADRLNISEARAKRLLAQANPGT